MADTRQNKTVNKEDGSLRLWSTWWRKRWSRDGGAGSAAQHFDGSDRYLRQNLVVRPSLNSQKRPV